MHDGQSTQGRDKAEGGEYERQELMAGAMEITKVLPGEMMLYQRGSES